MGQCYSVYLKAKLNDADAFVRLTREFTKDWSQPFKDKLTGINGVINFMIGDGSVDVLYEDGWPIFHGNFDASYSWDGTMEEWFRAVAPALEAGSEIEVWPDEGSWKCTVLDDGTCGKEYGEIDEDDEEEEIA